MIGLLFHLVLYFVQQISHVAKIRQGLILGFLHRSTIHIHVAIRGSLCPLLCSQSLCKLHFLFLLLNFLDSHLLFGELLLKELLVDEFGLLGQTLALSSGNVPSIFHLLLSTLDHVVRELHRVLLSLWIRPPELICFPLFGTRLTLFTNRIHSDIPWVVITSDIAVVVQEFGVYRRVGLEFEQQLEVLQVLLLLCIDSFSSLWPLVFSNYLL